MTKTLNGALPIMARYFCDDVGVEVVHGAYWPCTKNNKIYLPIFDEDEADVVKLALGFTGHESAHIKYSDQDVYDMAAQEPPFVVKFMNALEDIRIEDLMMKAHYIVRDWLAVAVRKVLSGPVSSDLSEAELLHNTCLIVGRARLLNQPLAAEADVYDEMLRKTFGPGRSIKILALLGQVTAQPNTMAVYHLAHRMLDVLDEEEPEEESQDDSQEQSGASGQPDQNQQPGEGSGGDEGDEEGDSDAGGQQASGDQGDQKQSGSQQSLQGDDESGDQSQGSAGDESEGAGNGAKQGEDEQGTEGSKQSLKEKVLSATKAECDEIKSDLGDALVGLLKDKIDTSGQARSAAVLKQAVGSSYLGPQTVANGRASSSGLRQVLLGLMQGTQNVRPVPRRTGRSIDASRLARVPVGEFRIFRKTDPVQRVNAAFQILLDASSSMGGNGAGLKPIRIAEEATVALLAALEGIPGVSTGAMVFPRTGPDGGDSVGVLKRHNQSFNHAVLEQRFGITESGSTPLAEAIWPAAGDVLAAKGQRKVLVIVTDGDPDNQTQAKGMVERCRATGIEVFCIGFGSIREPVMNTVFGEGNWKFLTELGAMRDALSQLVKNVLTNQAA